MKNCLLHQAGSSRRGALCVTVVRALCLWLVAACWSFGALCPAGPAGDRPCQGRLGRAAGRRHDPRKRIAARYDDERQRRIHDPDQNDNSELVFSMLGYVSQELRVGKRTVLDVALAEDTSEIDEVVVVGYGYVRRVDLTGSVASVNTEEMQKAPYARSTRRLQDVSPACRSLRAKANPARRSTSSSAARTP